jgi:radical SAM superfamily enzyme YgiQ (UPF0313 family)
LGGRISWNNEKAVRVLLISTYDLGRQPFGLASPLAWLRRAGVETDGVDLSREPLGDEVIRRAALIAFYLPMHTATRLATPVIDRVRALNPAATLAAYGLYAPLNAGWLRERGVSEILGPESEEELVKLANSQLPTPNSQLPRSPIPDPRSPIPDPRSPIPDPRSPLPRLQFIQPDRSTLPPLRRYAALRMPDGSRRVAGATDATRGCKHLCRHCPIVPVYQGAFRVVPVETVLDDARALVAGGAEHISFGDPDFFNGPTHARRVVEALAEACPGVTYDVTIKIEHLLKHADMLGLLRDTGCLFVTSAVESIDPVVLTHLRKGHTREDFVRAVALCRQAGVRLSPTFVPFTPWTTAEGYVRLLDQLADLELEEDVAPVQLGIRLLVTSESALFELDEIRALVDPFDAASLTWPWRHTDPSVDRLQSDVMKLVGSMRADSRRAVFGAIDAAARETARIRPRSASVPPRAASPPPHLTEAWYCCAEPGPDSASYV